MQTSSADADLIWVDQPQQLRAATKELAAQDILAVDTESNSLYAFKEQVCLIQFSTRTQDILVDALLLPDLSPLAEIFSSERILKVFHAAEYDLICLFRDHGFRFNFLFDTMIAARILGYQQTGLGALLNQHFGIQVNKKYQRANWGQRPLKAEMLDYARQDSCYLIQLQDKLRAELVAAGLWELALEDFRRLTQGVADTTESSEHDFWKLNGARDLSPEKAAVLKALYQYRETLAEAQNRPAFKVLSHQALIEMAQACPKCYTDLAKLSALHANQAQRYGRGLLDAVRAGYKAEPLSPPNHTRPHNSILRRIDALQTWRKNTGNNLQVPSDVILPRDVLNRIAWANPADAVALQAHMQDVPYRYERFGQDILSVIHPRGPSA